MQNAMTLIATAALIATVTATGAYADTKSRIELTSQKRAVPLYASPDMTQPPVERIAPDAFPTEIWVVDFTVDMGRMYNIKLVPDGAAYWVSGSTMRVLDFDGKVEILCESGQSIAPGATGRGAGSRSTCKAAK